MSEWAIKRSIIIMSNPLHSQETGEINLDSLVAATDGNDDKNRKSEYSGHHSFSVGKFKVFS